MGKIALKYSLIAIGLYYVAAYGTSFGQVIDSGTKGGATLVKAFQARS